MYLLDTCALLWWTLTPDYLSPQAKTVCHSLEQGGAAISSISLWEIAVKSRRKRLNLGMSFEEYYSVIKSSSIQLIHVDDEIWVKNAYLDWDHRDPVDRTLVATGIIFDYPIITKDERIRQFYKRTLW